MGNVVADFDHALTCQAISERHEIPLERVRQALFCPAIEGRFDRGAVNGTEFTQACNDALGIQLEPVWFQRVWSDIFRPNPATVALLQELKPQYRLVLVSNTNAWHIEQARRVVPIDFLFDDQVLSFEIGYAKPEEGFYRIARALDPTPGKPFFVDDRAENVAAADSFGFEGVLFSSAERLRQDKTWRR